MKSLILLSLFILVSCSSAEKKSKAPSEITNDDFKKQKPLTKNEVPDYYQKSNPALTPALQDETLDRLTTPEVEAIAKDGDALIKIALLCSQKDYKAAFAEADKGFNSYFKIPAYWNLLANCHLNSGSPRKALLFYNKALEVSPNYVPALNNIGVLYSRQGQDQKALIAFERANKTSKFSETPRFNLGKLYLTYGLVDPALPILQSLLTKYPQDVDLLNAMGSVYFLSSDYQRANSYYSQIPESQLSRAEIGINYALTLKKLGKSQEASKIFDDIDKPKNGALKSYYATAQSQLGVAE